MILDEQSMKLLKARDQKFLSEVFLDVNPYLFRVCAANGLLKQSAEEVISASWEKFLTNLDQFQGKSQIRTFLCGILFNKIRESRRAETKTILKENNEDILMGSFTEEGWWKSETTNPLKGLELQQSAKFVRECLEDLGEQEKMAFILKESEEESSTTICQSLGITSSNLGVLLFRARKKLRMCLQGKL